MNKTSRMKFKVGDFVKILYGECKGEVGIVHRKSRARGCIYWTLEIGRNRYLNCIEDLYLETDPHKAEIRNNGPIFSLVPFQECVTLIMAITRPHKHVEALIRKMAETCDKLKS